MKRNIKIIIASSLVLAFLLGAYFLIGKWNPETKEGQETTDEFPYADVDFLLDINGEDISSVEINTGNISYTLRNGSPVTIEGYSSPIIDPNKLSSVIYSATGIAVSRRIEDYTGSLSDYGLENPEKSVAVLMKDGTCHKLLIGNNTNFDGEYYGMLEGENSVFTLSSYTVDALMMDPSQFRNMNICTLSSDSIVSFTIKKNGQKEVSIKYDENFVPTNEFIRVSYLVTYPYDNVTASLDTVKLFFDSVASLTADEIVEENPKDLSLYGLDKPYELEVEDYNGKKTVIKAGSYGENGAVYIMCNDLPVVYLAECPFYETIKNARAGEYVDKFIHIYNIDTVEKIVVTADGEEHTLLNAKEGSDYKVDGTVVTEDSFKALYQLVIGVTAAEFTTDKEEGEVKCTFAFHFKDGTKKEFTYRIYNDRYSIVKASNLMTCLTLTKNIDDILVEIKKCESGKGKEVIGNCLLLPRPYQP